MADTKTPDGKTPSEFFKERLRTIRKDKRWSQQDLADRLAEMGAPTDRATIARTETGPRTITLDDTILFAAALDVSPLALILPRDDDAYVSVAPRAAMHAGEVRDWITGDMCITAMAYAKDDDEGILSGFKTVDDRTISAEEYFERKRFYEQQFTNRQWAAAQVPGLLFLMQIVKGYVAHAAVMGRSWRRAKLEQLQREVARQLEDFDAGLKS